ncbi:uncharacterized protein LOC144881434 isoform X2 [Branchiostoma floridae x Branchiostoma japonicum]
MDHKVKLQGVCRVCGLRFKFKKCRNPKPAKAFRAPISHLYEGCDVEHDNENIHPPYVCDKCRSSLWRVQSAIAEGKEPTTMLPKKLPDFSPHSAECSVCNYKETGRPVKKNIKSKRQGQEVASRHKQSTTPAQVSPPLAPVSELMCSPPDVGMQSTPPRAADVLCSSPDVSMQSTPPRAADVSCSSPDVGMQSAPPHAADVLCSSPDVSMQSTPPRAADVLCSSPDVSMQSAPPRAADVLCSSPDVSMQSTPPRAADVSCSSPDVIMQSAPPRAADMSCSSPDVGMQSTPPRAADVSCSSPDVSMQSAPPCAADVSCSSPDVGMQSAPPCAADVSCSSPDVGMQSAPPCAADVSCSSPDVGMQSAPPAADVSCSPPDVRLADGDIVAEATKYGYVHVGTAGNGALVLAKYHASSLQFTSQQQLHINQDRTWELYVHEKQLPVSDPVISALNLPTVIQKSNQAKLFFELSYSSICVGNIGYEELLEARREEYETVVFRKTDGRIAATEDKGFHVVEGGKTYNQTIRHVDCQLIIPHNILSSRCTTCKEYSSTLRKALHRLKNKPTISISHSSKVPNKHLTKEQLKSKTADIQREKRAQKSLHLKVKQRVIESIEKEGCPVNNTQHSFLQTVMKSTTIPFPENTPQHFLFKQQLEQLQHHDSRSMRWHPMMIRWCLAIFHQSPAAYKTIRESGFLHLPHRTTLQQYSKFTKPTPGFNPDILQRLGETARVDQLPDFQRNVSLIWDEMKIKSGLVYDKASGELVGFTDLGSVNEILDNFEKRCREEQHGTQELNDLATHVLAFMVRGVCSNLEFVFAYYPCQGFSSSQLFPAVWKATGILEGLGFYVRTFVCDGATPNRRFYKIHGHHGDNAPVVYWAWNKCGLKRQRKVYFICDVPHLIKTTRNNWENSGGNKRTRNLHYNHQTISWNHLVNLYEWDLGVRVERQAVGLRLLHKLKTDHVHLSPSLRMRVKLAVQVLSKSVSQALTIQGRHDTESTRKFVDMFDSFFDCLNVKKRPRSQYAVKPNLKPYYSVEDVRFTWLESEFLVFLDEWERQCQANINMTKKEKNKLCLSKQTLEGLRITVTSFVEFAKVLLQEDGVKYFLSEKLTQDPLEQHFAKQRGRCGANEHPTLLEYGRNEINIHVSGAMLASVRAGNYMGRANDVQIDFNDDTPLPKRQRKR